MSSDVRILTASEQESLEMCRNNMQLSQKTQVKMLCLFSKMRVLLFGKAARSPGAVFTAVADIPSQRWVRIRNHHRGFDEGSEHIACVDHNGDQPVTSDRNNMKAGEGQSAWVMVLCAVMHSPHNRIHGRGDRRLWDLILWNQDSEGVMRGSRSFLFSIRSRCLTAPTSCPGGAALHPWMATFDFQA